MDSCLSDEIFADYTEASQVSIQKEVPFVALDEDALSFLEDKLDRIKDVAEAASAIGGVQVAVNDFSKILPHAVKFSLSRVRGAPSKNHPYVAHLTSSLGFVDSLATLFVVEIPVGNRVI